jgi:outer membrane protein OmpA-like peptidoglycan-associated protein
MSVPGFAPTGCPDGDADGVLDRDDQCPSQAGLAPDGCPGDSDGDGLRDDVDKCPSEAETSNGFEDDDGCPDEVPDVVKRFSGAIDGITFGTNQAEIRPGSRGVLDEAARVLDEYPSLRVEVVGHTDDRGAREHNLDLSLRRAESVKAYLVRQGVEPTRLIVRGAGPDEPLIAEKTKEARQKNRRIEFRVLGGASSSNRTPSSTGN